MPTIAPSGAGDQPAVEKRDGGTVVNGGTLSSESPMTKNIGLSELADDLGKPYGSRVIAQDGNGGIYTDLVGISGAVAGAVTEGVTQLGYVSDATEWVVQAGNVTQTLGGNANTLLVGGAADVNGADPTRDATNQTQTARLLGDLTIDLLATPSSGYNSFATKSDGPGGAGGTLQNHIDPAVAGGATNASDSAGVPTRGVPGELTYMFGGKLPKQDNYKAKDSAES